jgi:hypothetical protein
VERSRLILPDFQIANQEPSRPTSTGFKRSYLDRKDNLAIGDLSNIKEVSRLNEEEVVSDVEFPQLSAKRQRVSNDIKEQEEAER